MKIIFYLPYTIKVYGGETKWLIEVSRRLSDLGHEIVILGLDKGSYIVRNEVKLPSKVEYLELKSIKPFKGFPIPSHKEQHKLISMLNDANIIYTFIFHLPNEILLTLKSRSIKVPLIGGIHNLPLFKWYMKIYLALSRDLIKKVFNAFHVLNRYSHNLLVTYKVPPNRVYMIPNGVDTDVFNLKQDVAVINSDYFEIIFVSRFTYEKGIDTLYKIITDLNERYYSLRRNILFKIAGTGPLKHYIKKLKSKYHNVLYLGYLDKKELIAEYNGSHVILITSRIENMPLTLLEASACGLPAVASAVPGVVDVIKTLGYGILVQPENIEGYVKGILYFYNIWNKNPEKYYDTRVNIRERIIANYDWNIIIDRIENMFKQVLLDREHKF